MYNPNVSFNKAKMSLVSNFSLYSDYHQENNIRDHTNSCVCEIFNLVKNI